MYLQGEDEYQVLVKGTVLLRESLYFTERDFSEQTVVQIPVKKETLISFVHDLEWHQIAKHPLKDLGELLKVSTHLLCTRLTQEYVRQLARRLGSGESIESFPTEIKTELLRELTTSGADTLTLSSEECEQVRKCKDFPLKSWRRKYPNVEIVRVTNALLMEEDLWFLKMWRIKSLDLSGNLLDERGIKVIVDSCPHLEILKVGRNQLADESAFELCLMTSLKSLCLFGNFITDVGAKALAYNLRALEELDLSFNKLTDEGALALTRLTELQTLSITQNKISQETCERLADSLPNLAFFNCGFRLNSIVYSF